MTQSKTLKSDLSLHWLFTYLMLAMLVTYNIVCHVLGTEIQINLNEEQRVLFRTLLYITAIIILPITNLLRYILLRLNQTMPGSKPAKNRYLMTTVVTQLAIAIVNVFGLIMFVLGDYYNTLYIFSGLGAIGIFLHRPKIEEYQQIIDALQSQDLIQQNLD